MPVKEIPVDITKGVEQAPSPDDNQPKEPKEALSAERWIRPTNA